MAEGEAIRLHRTDVGDFGALRALFDDPSFFGWGGSGRLSDELIREKYLGSRFPDVECFLVLIDDLVAGLAQIHTEPNGGGLDLILLPAARGHGIGRAVVAQLVERARLERGWSRLTVDPDVQNESGIRFWQAVGFTQESVITEVSGRPPHLLMTLQ
jgi:GNAT superfamily N-acetyltransferase